MEIAVFIQNIQEERAEVALYIFSNQTSAKINSTMNKAGNRMGLAERFQQTDRALEEVPTWPNVSPSIILFASTFDKIHPIPIEPLTAIRHHWHGRD